MGLYNAVFGVSPHAPIVLAILDQVPSFFGRFRDAWIEKTEDGGIRFAVYTRNGGGNRGDQSEAWDRIRSHALYLADKDDSFDSTYATAYFRVPTEFPVKFVEALPDGLKSIFTTKLHEIASEPVCMAERWKKAIDALGGVDSTGG